ncbi:hypothetical protein RFI_01011 [Reticulomyxa filosa]|uniref:PHD-type domain-containing protein n=1 Tax=Reticulomyxa filosa TaxID=46433 RepID=X6PED4_RETFI|nr:hypothetical protein RFI_01011 [Reticulomyxa filosa]|eukprot:ETO36052.1 hypothetical protein RFI_01011 [Reticulomyxa filosa]
MVVSNEEQPDDNDSKERPEDSDEDPGFCEVCGLLENITTLICDGCDGYFHALCVHLREVPEGDWFCPNCVKAREKREAQRKKRGNSMQTNSKKKNESRAEKKARSRKTTRRQLQHDNDEEEEDHNADSNDNDSDFVVAGLDEPTNDDEDFLLEQV